jgi:hypothetical protein
VAIQTGLARETTRTYSTISAIMPGLPIMSVDRPTAGNNFVDFFLQNFILGSETVDHGLHFRNGGRLANNE